MVTYTYVVLTSRTVSTITGLCYFIVALEWPKLSFTIIQGHRAPSYTIYCAIGPYKNTGVGATIWIIIGLAFLKLRKVYSRHALPGLCDLGAQKRNTKNWLMRVKELQFFF